MKKKMKLLQRFSSLMLAMLVVASTFCVAPITAGAKDVEKLEKSYDIAVVFDNSGSMYDNMGWCRAKYAMEIFASMLNYDKDKLHIFPMWEVTTDGSKPESGGSYAAFEITSKKDIDKISNLYTVHPSNTPFAPITEAHNYLKASNADEKWLVILTDGDFNQDVRGKAASIKLQERVSALASEEIKVQYLGFGGARELKANEARNFYAKKSSDTSLKDDLIEICNRIFQRSILPGKYLKGSKLTVDLSMKNVIVFAQGKNAKVTSLKNSGGKEIAITLDSGQRKYSEIKAKGYDNAPVDKSLAGQVVTFDACSKGEYILSYTGADKIQIFYEPDVDIAVELTNSDGQKVTGPDDFIAGEYKVTSRIVDASTGEDVTSHELMGNDVKLTTYVKTSKDSDYKEYENGSKIAFEPDSETEIYIEGEYLGKYKITSKDNPDLAWLSDITIKEPSVAFKLSVSAEQNWYVLKDHDEWNPIRVDLTLEGQPLTEEQMANTKLAITTTNDLKYRAEAIPGESAYNVYISQDEAGNYIEPETGRYKLTAKATYTDEYGKETGSTSEKDSVSFEIQKYRKFWRILIWILAILLLLALWLSYMLQKVLPKSIVKDTANFNTMGSGELDASFVDVEYRRKGKSLTIAGSSAVDFNEQCSASFSIRAVDNHFTSSKRRRIAITGVDSPCDEIKIAGTKYVNYEGQWVKATDLKKAESGKEVPPIDQEIGCSPRFELSRSGGLSTLTCKTKTVK